MNLQMNPSMNPSWTSYYLLNAQNLNKYCPLETSEKKISVDSPIIDTLAADHRSDTKVKVIGNRRAKTILRMAYTAKICLFYAPVGMVINGGKALKGCFLKKNDETATKVKAYRDAFRIDAKAFISGLTGTSLLSAPIVFTATVFLLPQITIAFAVSSIFTSVFSFFMGMRMLAGLDPSKRLAYLASQNAKDNAHLYSSLELRQKLGYVSMSGAPLHLQNIDFQGTHEACLEVKAKKSMKIDTFINLLGKNKPLAKLIKGASKCSNEMNKIRFYIRVWKEAETLVSDNRLSYLVRMFA